MNDERRSSARHVKFGFNRGVVMTPELVEAALSQLIRREDVAGLHGLRKWSRRTTRDCCTKKTKNLNSSKKIGLGTCTGHAQGPVVSKEQQDDMFSPRYSKRYQESKAAGKGTTRWRMVVGVIVQAENSEVSCTGFRIKVTRGSSPLVLLRPASEGVEAGRCCYGVVRKERHCPSSSVGPQRLAADGLN